MDTSTNKKVSEAARTLSKLGASKGGKARAEALPPEERQRIAREAIATRWAREKGESNHEDILTATHGSPDHPLRIPDGVGYIEIPCYVLEGGRRVVIQKNMMDALALSQGTASVKKGGDRLTKFATGKRLSPYISVHLVDVINKPIRFRTTTGNIAYGYEATILADICEAVLAARGAGALQKQQSHVAARCEILMRGFARVGIIALIDEVTGYQEYRDRLALQAILDKYITDEWAKWTKTFPVEYYKELFRLHNIEYPGEKMQKPGYVGHWTNDIVYSRLAPGVLKALRERNPRLESGYRARKHHQHLTSDFGHPKLKEHLSNIIFLMRSCSSWNEFKRRIDRAATKYGDTIPLDLKEADE